jgi:hypothetical protein
LSSIVLSFTVDLPAIELPSACLVYGDVYDNSNEYEKTLCYVKQKATYSKAKSFCMKNKMQLYRTESSLSAASLMTELASNYLKESSKAVVYVDGMKGSKCLTYSGLNKINHDWCSTSFHFICELNNLGKF